MFIVAVTLMIQRAASTPPQPSWIRLPGRKSKCFWDVALYITRGPCIAHLNIIALTEPDLIALTEPDLEEIMGNILTEVHDEYINK